MDSNPLADGAPISEERKCRACETTFTANGTMMFGQRSIWQRYCPPCSEIKNAEAEQAEKDNERRIIEDKWNLVCPAGYRDTKANDPRLNREALKASSEWATTGERGLGITGSTGAGKTRCMFLALRRAFDAGRSVAAISHSAFSKAVIEAFSGDGAERQVGKTRLSDLQRASVLLIDDLGKAPSTERVDAELEELIESRTGERKPVLWTANAGGAWLIKRFGPDRGEPIVRRLAEFCDVVTIAR